jgi:hypothetical protein
MPSVPLRDKRGFAAKETLVRSAGRSRDWIKLKRSACGETGRQKKTGGKGGGNKNIALVHNAHIIWLFAARTTSDGNATRLVQGG